MILPTDAGTLELSESRSISFPCNFSMLLYGLCSALHAILDVGGIFYAQLRTEDQKSQTLDQPA